MPPAPSDGQPLLRVEDLSVAYRADDGLVQAVRDASFTLAPGEVLGIVGESGSGKSTLAHAVVGYQAAGTVVRGGRVLLDGQSLLELPVEQLRSLWGRRLAIVHQNALATLTPTMTIGGQIAEVLRAHEGLGRAAALARAEESLRAINIPSPGELLRRYPHQLSGGQRQRVSIAIALSLRPQLLVLDEPTTNLDVTTEAVILDLLGEIRREVGSAMIYISHNLGVVARVADRIAVMYASEIVELAPAAQLFRAPRHPYTRALLDCMPAAGDTKRTRRLQAIPGALPSLRRIEPGCIFRARCDRRTPRCEATPPRQMGAPDHLVRCWHPVPDGDVRRSSEAPATTLTPRPEVVLAAVGLRKRYGGSLLSFGAARPPAVQDASISLDKAEIVGLVGESGSGKTTLLRCVAGFETFEAGRLTLRDEALAPAIGRRGRERLRALQMVFQDPESTLNPALSIGENLVRHVCALRGGTRAAARDRALDALAKVRLGQDYADRLPRELSGGEKQRVAIARAFLADPEAVLCDEPLSALDVSVQAAVVQLLLDLQQQRQAAYLLVSHDLSVVRYMADKIVVMYLGRIVEEGPAESFDAAPLHPYTEALLSASPSFSAGGEAIRLQGQIAEEDKLKPGCIFAARCPRHLGAACDSETPPWRAVGGRRFRCHHQPEALAALQGTAPSRPAAEERKVG